MIPRLLSIDELAERFGYPRWKVEGLVYRRQIPFHKIGGRVQFSEADITAWLEARKVPARKVPIDGPTVPERAAARSREAECAALGIPADHQFS